MVKQGSFFQRLKDRLGSGSGVRVEAAAPTAKSGAVNGGAGGGSGQPNGQRGGMPAAKPAPTRVEPERAGRDLVSEAMPLDTRSSRKLSDREEAMLALGGHFQELTALLRGSQARTDDQLGRLVAATDNLAALPAIGQQQLEMLRSLSTQLERQNVLGEQMAATVTRLPSLLQNVEHALARAAATDERTASTVREFQATMDRIHGAMGQMVAHSEQQAKATQQLATGREDQLKGLAEGLQQAQHAAVTEMAKSHDESLQSLRRTHEDQSNRLQRIVQEHAGWNRAVLAGIGLLVLGIGALIALQLFR
jgi:hypothetical protein